MNEIDSLDGLLSDDLWNGNQYAVGPNYDGTITAPAAAQPNNQAWDTGGQGRGNYTDAIKILTTGIAAYTATQQRIIANDYRSYQATAGGLFQVGQPSSQLGASASVAVAAPRLSGTGLLLIAGLIYMFVK